MQGETSRVTFKDGEQRIVSEIDETNVGADDISVLVYTVDEEEPPEPMKCSACGEHIGLANIFVPRNRSY